MTTRELIVWELNTLLCHEAMFDAQVTRFKNPEDLDTLQVAQKRIADLRERVKRPALEAN